MTYRWRSKKPAQRDANEPDIIRELQDRGALVIPLDYPVDLLVGYRGTWTLVEVKSGPNARVRPGQVRFLDQARTRGLSAVLMDHLDDVDEFFPISAELALSDRA